MLGERKNIYFSFLIIVIAILYALFAYTIERTDFTAVAILWCSTFLLSYLLIYFQSENEKLLTFSGILFRAVFIIAIPNLSQDFYRFLWDGRILLEGFNPYLSLPENWIANGNAPIAQAEILYKGMGQLNGSHYTNYPPLSQLCYFIAALAAKQSILGSVIILRVLIILADIGTLYFGKKILKALQIDSSRIYWFFLNPFIIIEMTGNLHFEAIMIFFIVWPLYLLKKNLWHWAAVVLGLSVSVKLIPLLFLPLFFQWFTIGDTHKFQSKSFIKLTGFYLITLLTVLLSFAPFLSEHFIANFSRTIRLWFQTFEFNASVYFIIRWVGYKIVGWNIIETAGKILPIITIVFLISATFLRKNRNLPQLITACLLCLSFYYFLSTTVHPWYIAVPLILSIFTRYKFALAWSFAIILSYTTYLNPDFKGNLWMVGLEYLIVFSALLFDILNRKQMKFISYSQTNNLKKVT